MAKVATSPFMKLKRRITREFSRRKLVGDIVICAEEYELLIDYLRNVYKGISAGSFSSRIDPVLLVAMVQVGVKHYDGNYWSHVARMLNVPVVTQHIRAVLNSSLTQTLRAYEKAMVGEGELVKNVLLHGFVSEH